MSTAKVPLLNDYKKEFLLRRIPQTLLGGINLKLSYDAPFYVYLLQIALWLLPLVIGGILSVAIEVGGLSEVAGCVVAGCVFGGLVLSLQIVHFIYSRKNTPVQSNGESTSTQQLKQLLAEEDEVYFDSCCSYTTYKFVLPQKRYLVNGLLHPVLAGALCGVGVSYTLPRVFNTLYNFNTGATVVLFIFSWLAICIAAFPLVAGGVPPEVAAFRFVDNWELAPVSRMFLAFVFYAFHFVQIYHSSFVTVNQVLHIVFVFLPLLWLAGVIPPIDSLILWLMEQLLVFAMGASPMATDARTVISFLLTGGLFVGACFLGSQQSLVLYSAVFGYLLSTDLYSVLIAGIMKLASKCNLIRTSQSASEANKQPFLAFLGIAWHGFVFALNLAVAAIAIFFEGQFTTDVWLVMNIFIISIMVVCQILADIQKVYVAFRIFRNAFYPDTYSTMHKFRTRKKLLGIFGYIYLGLHNVLIPLLLVAYLAPYLVWGISTLPSFVAALGTFHGFRMTWQRTRGALLTLVIVCTLNLITTYTSVTFPWYSSLTRGIQIILIDFLVDRSFRFLDNLWFALTLLVTSWTDKKQRRNSSVPLICLNIAFSPVVVGIAAVSALLAAPMLPLFTLPLFFIAFPRPNRFWPSSPGEAAANVCADTAYYQQMADDLTRKLARVTYHGTLHTFGSIGTDLPIYLVRSQDRTFWIQAVESGYGYASYAVKGLELQETSCHALEATRVDDACQAAFETPDARSGPKRLNPYAFFSGMTPLDTVFVNGYSDAKNSLAGIIDHPAALKHIHKDFAKALTWLLVRYAKEARKKRPPIPSASADSADTAAAESADATSKQKRTGSAITMESLNEVASSRARSLNRKAGKTPNGKAPAGKPPDGSGSSLGSLASILGSEDGRAGGGGGSAHPKIPGYVSDEEEEEDWEAESAFSDSGFGLPAVDVSERRAKVANGKGDAKGVTAATKKPYETSAYPQQWTQFDIGEQDLRRYTHIFDSSWFLHVVTSVGEEVASSGAEDDSLLNDCRRLVAACYCIVNVQGVPGKNPSLLGASHVCKVFSGDIPWSPDLDWLREQPSLCDLVVQAHRYAVKLMFDRAAMGTTDDAESEDFDETLASLREYDTEWHVGMETSTEWGEAASSGRASLFTVAYDSDKAEYSARVLIRRPVEAHVTLLSGAAVRGFWANQSAELLYATNDDEERYSIQAHPVLLRNLTVQAADPPLGYPVFSSRPMFERTLPVPVTRADRWFWS